MRVQRNQSERVEGIPDRQLRKIAIALIDPGTGGFERYRLLPPVESFCAAFRRPTMAQWSPQALQIAFISDNRCASVVPILGDS